jgi:squalene synthase HpnC
MELQQAYQYCQKLAQEHYENFPVASRLLPGRLRPHIAAIYAFARIADDFADEANDLHALLDWRDQLFRAARGDYHHPVFQALHHTIRTFQLPVQWLDDLLTAFQQDLNKNRYRTFDELIAYTRYSANPVGRLVLWLFGYRSEELMQLADHITTGLQLVNFWQDLSVDLTRNRLYIPTELLHQYGISESALLNQKAPARFPELLHTLYRRTRWFFRAGRPLLHRVSGRLKWELKLTVAGGEAILDKTLLAGNKILFYRPNLNKFDWMKLIFKTVIVF